MYRGLINARAIGYSFLVVKYDVNLVYLELTLVRVVLSWAGSLLMILLFPRFIGATLQEKALVLKPVNLALKALGSAAIIASLVLLNR